MMRGNIYTIHCPIEPPHWGDGPRIPIRTKGPEAPLSRPQNIQVPKREKRKVKVYRKRMFSKSGWVKKRLYK